MIALVLVNFLILVYLFFIDNIIFVYIHFFKIYYYFWIRNWSVTGSLMSVIFFSIRSVASLGLRDTTTI